MNLKPLTCGFVESAVLTGPDSAFKGSQVDEQKVEKEVCYSLKYVVDY